MTKYTCGAGTPEEAEANCTSFINGECTASWCEYRKKKETNLDIVRRFTPEQLARFIAWLSPNFCHDCFRPIYHEETHENGTKSKVCEGKCTECIVRFLEAEDGIYFKGYGYIEAFDPEKDYHV